MDKVKPVKILGINAGPREGNSSRLLKYALEACEEMPEVTTQYLSMHEHKVNHCTGCRLCYGDKKGLLPDSKFFCHYWHAKDPEDEGDLFVRGTLECDGAIIASPVHEFDISAECKALFGRICKPCDEHVITPWIGQTRHKPLGACSTSFCSHGGGEHTVASIHRFGMGLGWLPVGAALTTEPDHNPTSSHFGGIGAVNCALEWDNPDAITPEHSRIKPPAIAVQAKRAARCTGRNVATIALIVKNGKALLEQLGYKIPQITFPKRWPKAQIKKGSYMEYLVQQGKIIAVEG